MKLNLNINGPFRALIQMAKAFKDPTQVIAPVMPFPIDSPALKVELQNMTKQEKQSDAAQGRTARKPITTPRRNAVRKQVQATAKLAARRP